MSLTVAVCTYNPDRELLGSVLQSIFAQLREVPSAELLVIDNASSPPVESEGWESEHAVRIVREQRPGLTAAREAAIAEAEGEAILFVDDDNILHEGYLERVRSSFEADPRLGLLGGGVFPRYSVEPPAWFREFEPWLAVRRCPPETHTEIAELSSSGQATREFPIGAGFAVRRDVAIAYKEDCGATQRIEGRKGEVLSSGEDLDLALYCLEAGYTLVVDGSISLTHVIPPARLELSYLQRMAAGNVRSSVALEHKWAPRLGRPIYPLLEMATPQVLARLLASSLLGLGSPAYRVKRALYGELLRVKRERAAGAS